MCSDREPAFIDWVCSDREASYWVCNDREPSYWVCSDREASYWVCKLYHVPFCTVCYCILSGWSKGRCHAVLTIQHSFFLSYFSDSCSVSLLASIYTQVLQAECKYGQLDKWYLILVG